MQAFLIDPFACTVTAVEYDGDYHSIYQLIGADLFDAVTVDGCGTTLFIDDEGLFRECQRFFVHAGYPQPLAGKALVLGTDLAGASVAPCATLEQVAAAVRWVAPVRISDAKTVWIEVSK